MKLFSRKKNNKIWDQSPEINLDESIVQRFDQMVHLFPNKVALEFFDKKLSFSDLDQKAKQLAQNLLKAFGEQRVRIAILLPPGFEQIISVFGILKAGMVYVPIDYHFPEERIRYMIEDSNCHGLICNNSSLELAESTKLDTILINLDQQHTAPETKIEYPNVSTDDLMMIVYTSGSSGKPKGVMHSHKNLVHSTYRLNKLINITPDDEFSFYFSISFSAHGMIVFSSLLNGCTLHLFNFSKGNYNQFVSWYKSRRITVDLMIPSVMIKFFETFSKNEELKSIRVLLIGGEVLFSVDLKVIWRHIKRETIVYNLYASSEAYVCCAKKIEKRDIQKSNKVPIGLPLEGMELYCGQKNDESANSLGELYVASDYLSEGYASLEEVNSKVYIHKDKISKKRIFKTSDLVYQNEEGEFIVAGRKDSMVKIRGHRVDLNEIEAALKQFDSVKETKVKLVSNQYSNDQLVAYLVFHDKKDLGALKIGLQRKLPVFMVPSFFEILDALPKNASGKIDSKNLPEPSWKRFDLKKEIILPQTQNEKILSDIFERVLEVKEISIDDNLFEIGADSLKLFVAFDKIEKQFGMKLDLKDSLKNLTIQNLSKLMN